MKFGKFHTIIKEAAPPQKSSADNDDDGDADDFEVNDETHSLKGKLYHIAKEASAMHDMIEYDDDVDDELASKIIKAAQLITDVHNHLDYVNEYPMPGEDDDDQDAESDKPVGGRKYDAKDLEDMDDSERNKKLEIGKKKTKVKVEESANLNEGFENVAHNDHGEAHTHAMELAHSRQKKSTVYVHKKNGSGPNHKFLVSMNKSVPGHTHISSVRHDGTRTHIKRVNEGWTSGPIPKEKPRKNNYSGTTPAKAELAADLARAKKEREEKAAKDKVKKEGIWEKWTTRAGAPGHVKVGTTSSKRPVLNVKPDEPLTGKPSADVNGTGHASWAARVAAAAKAKRDAIQAAPKQESFADERKAMIEAAEKLNEKV